jgi:hypothetical protein
MRAAALLGDGGVDAVQRRLRALAPLLARDRCNDLRTAHAVLDESRLKP